MMTLRLLRPRIDQLPWRTGTYFVGAYTNATNFPEIVENGVGLRSLLRFLTPTPFGDLPDRRGYS